MKPDKTRLAANDTAATSSRSRNQPEGLPLDASDRLVVRHLENSLARINLKVLGTFIAVLALLDAGVVWGMIAAAVTQPDTFHETWFIFLLLVAMLSGLLYFLIRHCRRSAAYRRHISDCLHNAPRKQVVEGRLTGVMPAFEGGAVYEFGQREQPVSVPVFSVSPTGKYPSYGPRAERISTPHQQVSLHLLDLDNDAPPLLLRAAYPGASVPIHRIVNASKVIADIPVLRRSQLNKHGRDVNIIEGVIDEFDIYRIYTGGGTAGSRDTVYGCRLGGVLYCFRCNAAAARLIHMGDTLTLRYLEGKYGITIPLSFSINGDKAMVAF